MEINFREFNPFDLWIWIEFETVPSLIEQQYIEELINSWFYLGKLGAFNAENLQVMETGIDISYMDYSQDYTNKTMMSVMHNISDVQYQGVWGRLWIDLGTSDLIAIDLLINALTRLSEEYFPVRQIIFGGENEDWSVDEHHQMMFE